MVFSQVRDVVALIRKAHQQLRQNLKDAMSQPRDSRTKEIVDTLNREEQDLQRTLAECGAESQDSPLLDVWLQYIPDESLHDALTSVEFSSDLSADEVVVRKLQFDQALVTLLDQLAQTANPPSVKEFFELLSEHIATRATEQAWNVREYQADAEPPRPG